MGKQLYKKTKNTLLTPLIHPKKQDKVFMSIIKSMLQLILTRIHQDLK